MNYRGKTALINIKCVFVLVFISWNTNLDTQQAIGLKLILFQDYYAEYLYSVHSVVPYSALLTRAGILQPVIYQCSEVVPILTNWLFVFLVRLLFEWIPKVLFVNSFSVERSLDAVCLFPSERGAGSPGSEGAPDCLSWWVLRVVCAAESQVMRYVCKKGLVASSKLDWLLCLQLNCFVEEQDWNLETRKLLEA